MSSSWIPLLFNLFIFLSSSDPTLSETPNFLKWAKTPELFEYMVRIRMALHENPELGFAEFETSKLIRNELDEMGILYKYPIAVTGVVGFIGTGNPPFVAIRADMDALEIEEAVEWEHKSKIPGKMHACGHDTHVAMLLGAAKMLQEHRHDFEGTVLLVFQPAEEGGGGAKKMVEAGILKNVDAIFGLHVSSRFPLGTVATRSGPVLAASGFFEAKISGKGGHAAIPQNTIDPILAISNIIVNLQHLVSREADPLGSQVVSIGNFEGGHAFNVIPDSVTIGGTFRAFSKESFLQLKRRIEESDARKNSVLLLILQSEPFTPATLNVKLDIFFLLVEVDAVSNVAEVISLQAGVQRCNASVSFFADEKPFYPVTVNDKDLHRHFLKMAADMLGADNIKEVQPSMGAEDFAFFAEEIPGYFYFIGMPNETKEPLQSRHSPYFRVNEDVLPYGAAFHASLAVTYLGQLRSLRKTQGRFHDEW